MHFARLGNTLLKDEESAHRRGRPRTAWMDNIKTWTGLPVEESVRMTEDRDKWRKYVHGVPTVGSEYG